MMHQKTQSTTNYLKPFIFMVTLMALIGFITSLNQQFQAPLKSTFLIGATGYENSLSTMLNFAFFVAYLVIGPFASSYLNRQGYRAALLKGIRFVMYAMILFLLSALLFEFAKSGKYISESVNHISIGSITLPLSFFIFLAGSFVSGAGLTFLQSSVNPYLVICEVRGTTGVTRQNIGGTGNSLMTTLAPLFVAYVVFGGKHTDAMQIADMIIPFAVLVVLMALLWWGVGTVHLPELEDTRHDEQNIKAGTLLGNFPHLTFGILGLFVYVGCEVCIGSNIIHYATGDLGVLYQTAVLWSTLYWLGMLIARFLSSFLSMVKAETQLFVAALTALVLVILSMVLKDARFLIAVGLFHSVMWGAVYALALEGLGKYAAQGSGYLLMGVVGGAVLPFLQGIWADAAGSWGMTWIILIVGEAYLLFYAIAAPKWIRRTIERSFN